MVLGKLLAFDIVAAMLQFRRFLHHPYWRGLSWFGPVIGLGGLIFLLFLNRTNWLVVPITQQTPSNSPQFQVPHGKLIIGNLDGMFDSRLPDGTGVITIQAGASIRLFGWAASTSDATPIKQISVWVNDTMVGKETHFFERPDVASAYRRADFAMSGWETEVRLKGVTAGTYRLSVQAVATDGKTAILSQLRLVVMP